MICICLPFIVGFPMTWHLICKCVVLSYFYRNFPVFCYFVWDNFLAHLRLWWILFLVFLIIQWFWSIIRWREVLCMKILLEINSFNVISPYIMIVAIIVWYETCVLKRSEIWMIINVNFKRFKTKWTFFWHSPDRQFEYKFLVNLIMNM